MSLQEVPHLGFGRRGLPQLHRASSHFLRHCATRRFSSATRTVRTAGMVRQPSVAAVGVVS
jgi:hypothetical protein